MLRGDAAETRSSWLGEYEHAIRRFITEASRLEVGSLTGYFDEIDGELDYSRYRNQANAKISRDVGLAKDKGFAERYIAGYSFPRVPQLGDDFEEFALDWCRSVLNKMQQRRVSNKLVLAIRSELLNGKFDTPESSEELLALLRDNWPQTSRKISGYHRD